LPREIRAGTGSGEISSFSKPGCREIIFSEPGLDRQKFLLSRSRAAEKLFFQSQVRGRWFWDGMRFVVSDATPFTFLKKN
jgi:hypothetical protein